MNAYVELVIAYPIYNAMIQFAVLGTLGDILSKWMQQGNIFFPYNWPVILLKMLEWAIIAITIKYAFVGYQGFLNNLTEHHLMPEMGLFGSAFALSVFYEFAVRFVAGYFSPFS
jgi:hypothetical protein